MKSQFNKYKPIINSRVEDPRFGESACLRREILISALLTGLVHPSAGLATSPIDSDADTLEELLRTGTKFVYIGTPRKIWHFPEENYREPLEFFEKNRKIIEKEGADYGYEIYLKQNSSDAKVIRTCERSEGPSSGCLFFLEISVKRVAFISPRAEYKPPTDAKLIYLALGSLNYLKDDLGAWQQTLGKEMVILTMGTRESSYPYLLPIHQPVLARLRKGKLPIPIKNFSEVEKIARNLGFFEPQ